MRRAFGGVLEVSTHRDAVSVHIGAFSVEHRSGPVSGRHRGGHELLHHDRKHPSHRRRRQRPSPLRALLLIHRGRIAIELLSDQERDLDVGGIAIGEGRLRLDERLTQMLPRYAAEMTPSVARITLRQLLTHTAGFTDTASNPDETELVTSPDWVRFILKHQDYAPGAQFHYSDYGAHLLSPILVQATGQSVLAYARAKLFDPLGIVTRPASEPPFDEAHAPEYDRAGFAWPIDPQGFQTTGFFLKLRPRDMATFGQLFLQNGQWNGQQIVPTARVRQATTGQAGKSFPDYGSSAPGSAFNPTNYGYFWWVEPTSGVTAYYAWGSAGQLIEVVPSLHLLIVVSSNVDETRPGAPVVGPDEVQHLVDAIVPIIKTHPTR